ncbi:hypothetical protein HER10_EVM0006523 [Colletotrichum scovillei]|uniref:Uncharacterized protein n=1 Tax=Colletotrichum scovillei TaxID=1209932 RepID=A0A9P7R7W0_9PEZI|nr:uncharacterized protein HER10_EVM0006523 [Colletotrichum scovillei]KAF4783128.1 hypothetical protein HER10_EVM0006523 [Colletotrichum scovillei]KAG7051781.1 hypothetical protein JMJ77_0002397 [Colletotrichum scovillei]KAG7070816.1 hypothetical protein JMJ76_0002061 [Colletotrichum scovillei]KAG7079057.1 hypothetical protein JMJ78_0002719 [Colletotrichum scovillei]
MSQTPSTPVKVPPSAANHSAATLDPELRSQINTLLLKDGHVTKIQEQLLHSLHANQANWPTLIQNHALNLLRTGEVSTFPDLLRRVLDDVRQDTLDPSAPSISPSTAKTNGAASEKDKDKDKKTNGTASSTPAPGGADSSAQPNLAIPSAVIDEAIKVTQESLEAVCEIDSTS